ncbi:hypothetical protein HK405_002538, partial [Cladochytrium tenue]
MAADPAATAGDTATLAPTAASAAASGPLFDPALIGVDVSRQLPAGYVVRPLDASDFGK